MSKVVVLVETDHEDADEAVASVANAMRRAGYEVPEHGVGTRPVRVIPDGWAMTMVLDGSVSAWEPEVYNGPTEP